MSDNHEVEKLVKKVQANKKYQSIMPDLITRLSKKSCEKGLHGKAAVKDIRNKLHQIGGAYFKRQENYIKFQDELTQLPQDIMAEPVRRFCISKMGSHASTAERLPILEDFFNTCLESISPVRSILDLACGMNPLSIPWIPLDKGFIYHACDIYMDMLAFIQSFFIRFEINGRALPCDLTAKIPKEKAHLAFILKSIPCLEQIDKTIGLRLLDGIQADHILVSFPVSSLGGRKKGMADYYQNHFYEMISEKSWKIIRFEFTTELAFLVTK